MVAGRSYTLQASLVGYAKLLTTINITPQK
jgi:hypothetical protein